MKYTIVILFFLLIANSSEGQQKTTAPAVLPPKVDWRVELLGITARLADYQEYSSPLNKSYTRDIYKYFEKYKQHPLIVYMREIRHTNLISYDAVMAMAIHLSPAPDFTPVVAFNQYAPEVRWGKPAALKFARLLQQFYTDTNAEKFFNDHNDAYKIAENQFTRVFKELDVNWFKQYYGLPPKEQFNVIIGLGNGGANYSQKVVYPNGSEVLYAIMGTWSFNDQGEPVYTDASYLPTLIHEFNHSFVNYLTAKNETALSASGKIIYQSDSAKMQNQAYADWRVMLSESLVRASVIRYLMSHNTNPTVAIKEIQLQSSKGFIWIKQLVDLLGTYEKNRKRYPTLNSFMPQIIKFYNITAANINSLRTQYLQKLAHVSAIKPFSNGDTNVNPQLTEIKVYFDKPLSGEGVSINWGKGGSRQYPITRFLGYTNNNTAIALQVALQPGADYQFVLTGLSFKTADGYPLQEYEVHFKTAK